MSQRTDVQVIVQGPVGAAKTTLLGQIEKALLKLDIPVEWENSEEAKEARGMSDADIQATLLQYSPTVTLVERNLFSCIDDIAPLVELIGQRLVVLKSSSSRKQLFNKLIQMERDVANAISMIVIPENDPD